MNQKLITTLAASTVALACLHTGCAAVDREVHADGKKPAHDQANRRGPWRRNSLVLCSEWLPVNSTVWTAGTVETLLRHDGARGGGNLADLCGVVFRHGQTGL